MRFGGWGWGAATAGMSLLFSNHSEHLRPAHSQRGGAGPGQQAEKMLLYPGLAPPLGCHGWGHRDKLCHERGEKAAWEPFCPL